MKTRSGFVSNSSSSSYICEVCNNTESGWDLCLSEAEMFECENGHVVDEDCAPDFEPVEEGPDQGTCKDENCAVGNGWDAKFCKTCGGPTHDEESSYDEDWRYHVKEAQCPICSLSNIPPDIMVNYLCAKFHVSRDEITKGIQSSFGSLTALCEWVETVTA